jgi:hypothetical protein
LVGNFFRDFFLTVNNYRFYAKAVLKSAKLNTVAQQREAVTRGRSLLPYRLRYNGNYPEIEWATVQKTISEK